MAVFSRPCNLVFEIPEDKAEAFRQLLLTMAGACRVRAGNYPAKHRANLSGYNRLARLPWDDRWRSANDRMVILVSCHTRVCISSVFYLIKAGLQPVIHVQVCFSRHSCPGDGAYHRPGRPILCLPESASLCPSGHDRRNCRSASCSAAVQARLFFRRTLPYTGASSGVSSILRPQSTGPDNGSS